MGCPLWLVGLSIAFIFSICAALGINIQKYALVHSSLPAMHQPLWWLGFAIICTGSLLDFVALGMAPASLLAPLAALSLVWNLILAPLFHGEKVTLAVKIGMTFNSVGARSNFL
jgi:drug/metabolite transporter (DMT)-like permease